ncbi:MAG: hypothetical protein WAT42_01750 [Candidatus Nanopelagicales bacterium]
MGRSSGLTRFQYKWLAPNPATKTTVGPVDLGGSAGTVGAVEPDADGSRADEPGGGFGVVSVPGPLQEIHCV